MTRLDRGRLEAALNALPAAWPGPGGVAGLVKDGVVVETRAWGFANLATHLPMTRQVRLPLCSVTKQFTCGVLIDRVGDPARLDARVRDLLPVFTDALPTVAQLGNNQSGLRDHWAMTVLEGAEPGDVFDREAAVRMMAGMKTGQFAPGSQYSYCNTNFRIIAELLERDQGQPMDVLYGALFDRAGMETAVLTADTSMPADGVAGYEGTTVLGFFPAVNRIYWCGDAGISASLDDMLAWEIHIDQTRDDPGGLYRRLAEPQRFGDGRPAAYGNGLAHGWIAGQPVTGHGGALRGFRVQRFHMAQERLSVVVMFNHEANAYAAATSLLHAALGVDMPAPKPAVAGWEGQWIEPQSQLLLRVSPGLEAQFQIGPDQLEQVDSQTVGSAKMTLRRDEDTVIMDRPGDNLRGRVVPVVGMARHDICGSYTADETGARLDIVNAGGAVHAGFSGALGVGAMAPMTPVADDLWLISTRRALDAPAPGDWTLRFDRAADGCIVGATLGCWLARKMRYRRSG